MYGLAISNSTIIKDRAAAAGKAPKAWALLIRFWVSMRSYKKQPVKKNWGRILGLAWLKFAMASLKNIDKIDFYKRVHTRFWQIHTQVFVAL